MSQRHGNKQKHETGNPLQRALIARFHGEAARLVKQSGAHSILEVGCGEGYVLEALMHAGVDAQMTGVDLSQSAIADARARLPEAVELEVRDARELASHGSKYDLVMMLEVLEHIPEPSQMLAVLASLTRRHVLLSVPWEPFFRGLNFLRGKHLDAWGNDPEHVNHWGRRSFVEFIGQHFRVLSSPIVFPWTMVLAEPLATARA